MPTSMAANTAKAAAGGDNQAGVDRRYKGVPDDETAEQQAHHTGRLWDIGLTLGHQEQRNDGRLDGTSDRHHLGGYAINSQRRDGKRSNSGREQHQTAVTGKVSWPARQITLPKPHHRSEFAGSAGSAGNSRCRCRAGHAGLRPAEEPGGMLPNTVAPAECARSGRCDSRCSRGQQPVSEKGHQ